MNNQANKLRIIGGVWRRHLLPIAPVEGDLNEDGIVGVVDLLVLLAAWGACPGCPADLDCDGFVGVVDLLTLLANWS